MNAPTPIASASNAAYTSLSGTTSMGVRHAADPDAVRLLTTEELRRRFLVETPFRPDAVALTYSHVDRVVVGGAMPVAATLALEALKPIGSERFLQRRELGVINVGGAGRVRVDGEAFELAKLDSLYVAMGARDVRFESAAAGDPAKFYLVSTPAHVAYATTRIAAAQTKRMSLGSAATANARTIHQVIQPDVCRSCQLAMGFTVLESGSVWNTMPPHLHDRRCEIYFYFDLAPDARVFHLMGEPAETRHIVVANEQAVLSPVWSIHSGVGTASYAFVWAMGGDNQDYADMDAVAVAELR